MIARRSPALRTRITAVLAIIVAVTMALAATTCFVAMRGSLRGETDRLLREQAGFVKGIRAQDVQIDRLQAAMNAAARRQNSGLLFQLIMKDERAIKPVGSPGFAITNTDRATLARPRGSTSLADRTIDGEHFRVITASVGLPQLDGIQIGRSLENVDLALDRLAWILLMVGICSTAIAAIAAWLLTRPIVAPTESALAGSLAAQRQLVADASHELRTPITSLHTNAQLLTRHHDIDPSTRDQIARELVQQSEGLTQLVNDLLDLAKDPTALAFAPVRLDEIAAGVIADTARLHPAVTITERLQPCLVNGARPELERVVRNLLENAIIHGAPAGGGPTRIEVEVSARAALTVRDSGRGVDRNELGQVFDRFTRGAASRGRPGSGLGLAIVKQIIDAHGGTVELRPLDDGAPGTIAQVRLAPIGSAYRPPLR